MASTRTSMIDDGDGPPSGAARLEVCVRRKRKIKESNLYLSHILFCLSFIPDTREKKQESRDAFMLVLENRQNQECTQKAQSVRYG